MKIVDYKKLLKTISRGSGVLDALLGLGLVAAGALGYEVHYMSTQQLNMVAQTLASQQKAVANAAAGYIRTYYSTIEGVATSSTPATITEAMLQSTGFLQPGFSSTNAYGMTYKVSVLQPSTGQLTAILAAVPPTGKSCTDVTNPPRSGNGVFPCSYLPTIAAMQGAQGGYVPDSALGTTGTAVGAGNTWSLTSSQLSSFGLGSLPQGTLLTYLNYSPQDLMGDTLYRTNTGNSNASTMATTLNFANGNTLANLPLAVTTGAPTAAGCPGENPTTLAAITIPPNGAANASGVVVVCNTAYGSSGGWQGGAATWGQLQPGSGATQTANGSLQMNGNLSVGDGVQVTQDVNQFGGPPGYYSYNPSYSYGPGGSGWLFSAQSNSLVYAQPCYSISGVGGDWCGPRGWYPVGTVNYYTGGSGAETYWVTNSGIEYPNYTDVISCGAYPCLATLR